MGLLFRHSRTALLALMISAPLLAQSVPSKTAPAAVTVNMRDVEIADVAQEVSRLTGRTIILDPAVKGTVNVVSSTPQGPDGVWQLFVSVLRGQGFAVVRNGRAWRVIPQASAAREPANGSGSGLVVTRTIRLDNVSPEAALRVFKPLIAGFGSIEMVTNPNAIVVTDYADNVARIEALAHALDRSRGAGFDTIKLRHAAAKDVAAAIQGMVSEGENAPPRAVADARSNTVLVRGDPALLAEARRIAAMLDQPSGTAPTTRVFRLRYNDAESVTDVLRGLIGGQSAASNPVARTLSNGSAGGATSVAGLGALQASTATGFGGSSSFGGSGGLGSLSQNTGSTQITGSSGVGSALGMNPLPASGASGSAKSGGGGGFVSDELAVEPAPELNAIVVRGTPAAILAIEPLITQLDVRRPQVMIEAAGSARQRPVSPTAWAPRSAIWGSRSARCCRISARRLRRAWPMTGSLPTMAKSTVSACWCRHWANRPAPTCCPRRALPRSTTSPPKSSSARTCRSGPAVMRPRAIPPRRSPRSNAPTSASPCAWCPACTKAIPSGSMSARKSLRWSAR
jgi:general secretion pathway protein D